MTFSVHIGGGESPKALVVRDYDDRMMRRLEDEGEAWGGKERQREEIGG